MSKYEFRRRDRVASQVFRGTPEWLEARELLSTVFSVTNTLDDGSTGSLRWAIGQVNADNADTVARPDQIDFAIQTTDAGYSATTGVWTIGSTTLLPTVTRPADINGYSQTGASPNTSLTTDNAIIKIRLTSQGGDGLAISASESTVSGLSIVGCPGAGVHLLGVGGDVVSGNFLGLNPDGVTGEGNYQGVVDESPDDTIGGNQSVADRNIVAANGYEQISLVRNGSHALIAGNFVGLQANGQSAVGSSTLAGIYLAGGGNNVIGGTTPEARNVVDDGQAIGSIWDTGSSSGTQIIGNYVGTDATGTKAVPNEANGIVVYGADIVGGTQPGDGNLASGNPAHGIVTNGASLVEGNLVGTTASGLQPLGNGDTGIEVVDSSLKAASPTGVVGNTIAYNGGDGIQVDTGATGIPILSNAIYGNAQLGIDLNHDGLTLNTLGGPHVGANNLENYPVLSTADSTGGTTTITGAFNGTPNAKITIQFFANPTADPSGYGQGQTYIGELTDVSTDANGDATFSFVGPGIYTGQFISATATDAGGNTSEFAADIQEGAAPSPDADIAVSMLTEPTNATFDGALSYTFVVHNLGPSAAPDLVINDTLPSSMTGIVASATLGTYSLVNNVFTDTIASLPAGGSLRVTFTATAGSVGTISQTLMAVSSAVDPNPANNSASVSTQVGRAITTTTLTIAPEPSHVGQTLTLMASISPSLSADGTPGTVTFIVDGSAVAVVAINSDNTASYALSGLMAGVHTMSASYSGDAEFTPSQTAILQTVNMLPTVTSLSVSPNPSTLGQGVRLTAVVTGAISPTGTVLFSVDGTLVGTAVISSTGGGPAAASLTATNLGGGSHKITATYSGDTDLATSTASVLNEVVIPAPPPVPPATTTTSLLLAPNPSIVGEPVTLIATVSGPVTQTTTGVLQPTGVVTFFDGSTVLGQAVVGDHGQAVFVAPSLATGLHTLTAQYLGNAAFSSSSSPAANQVVNVIPTLLSVARYGIGLHPTTVVLAFNTPIDPVSAGKLANYTITGPRKQTIHVAGASLSADGQTLTLVTAKRLSLLQTYTLDMHGTAPGGLKSTAGLALNAVSATDVGRDSVVKVSIRNLVKTPPKVHAKAVHPAAEHVVKARPHLSALTHSR